MRRREFTTLLGASAAWPLVARAQATPVVGVLNGQSSDTYARYIGALRQGLSEGGYVEGQNLTIEYRWGEGHDERLAALATDLVQHRVSVIVSGGSPTSTLAAKAATSTIPVVFTTGVDPVKLGFVASFNRPGGNLTGVASLLNQVIPKRLELLHQLQPNVKTVAALMNLNNPTAADKKKELADAAQSVGLQLDVLGAGNAGEIDTAFAAMAERKPNALFVDADPFFLVNRAKIIGLAARHALPAVYESRDYAADGGLISYGSSLVDAYRLTGTYAARVLKGESPADLPVLQPTTFELVINLKTAKTLGLKIPQSLLVAADEVIE
ncbi:MAG TPA: ABC transporter substrate-binding protein [Xanthobacteraceae bacterium]|jgi:putative ABC transport system substrate-binding protein